MARAIYEIKLKEHFFPALSKADALEMQYNGGCAGLTEDDVTINMTVNEEHTLKLFTLAKTLYDMDKFNIHEIEAALRAVVCEMGYTDIQQEVTDTVTRWIERVGEEMTIVELEEWLLG